MNGPRAQLIDLLKQRQGQLAVEESFGDVPRALASQPAGTVTVHTALNSTEMQVMAQVAQDDPPETFFYARNQTEMSKAQEALVAWADAKVRLLKKELNEAAENVLIATKRKWKKAPFERVMDRAAKKLTFYEKVQAALKAGYVIVPDMNVELFAIRTTRKSAKQNKVKGQWSRPNDQKTNSPPLGEGRYVTPQGEQVWANEVKKHEPGKQPEYEIARWVEGHDEEIDFPFRLAKPAILNATADAMAGKFFDEMGVLPRFRKQPDPVVVGRIVYKEGYVEKRFNFLIVWYIDTREL
jgi:hypothetical protein